MKMAKDKKWEKLQDQQPKPKEDERTFDRKEIVKAMIKIRRKRPMIRSHG